MVHGSFMVGNLNEARASMEKPLSFAKKLWPDTAKFFPIVRRVRSHIRKPRVDWDAWLTKDGLP